MVAIGVAIALECSGLSWSWRSTWWVAVMRTGRPSHRRFRLLLPLDLNPDFIPVVGYADDAIIVAIALRSVVRVAGPEALDKHWPGSPNGLTAVKRLAGIV